MYNTLGGNKEFSECKQLSNTSHYHVKVTTKAEQWSGIKAKLRVKMGKFGIHCSNLANEGPWCGEEEVTDTNAHSNI